MKKVIVLISCVLLISVWSCGDSSNTTETKEETKETKEETKQTYDKETKEGMLQLLKECNIDVPGQFEFIEITKKSSSYSAKFVAENSDEATKAELDEWYFKKVEELATSGWKKRVVRDNEEMMGSVLNEIIVYKPDEMELDLNFGFTISTNYEAENSKYTLFINAE